jgi:predicted PurR-regulated permease PerM
VRSILPPFLIAFFLASLLDPVVANMQSKGVSRGRVVGSIFLLIFALLFLAGWLIIPNVVRQTTELANNLPAYSQNLTTYTRNLTRRLDQFYERHQNTFNNIGIKEKPSDFLSSRSGPVATAIGKVLHSVNSVIQGMIGQVLWLIIIPLALFYFLLDYEIIRAKLISFVPNAYRAHVNSMSREIVEIFSAYMRGLAKVCVLYGLAATILFYAFGLNYFVFMGIAAGVLYAVPYVGPAIAIGSSGVLAILTGKAPGFALLIVIAFIAMHVVFDYVITPRVVGSSVGLHPLVNVFALMCGATLFGVWGMLLAVPVAASIQMLLIYFFPRLAEVPIADSVPPPMSIADSVALAEEHAETSLMAEVRTADGERKRETTAHLGDGDMGEARQRIS